jgi:hypothetical protein
MMRASRIFGRGWAAAAVALVAGAGCTAPEATGEGAEAEGIDPRSEVADQHAAELAKLDLADFTRGEPEPMYYAPFDPNGCTPGAPCGSRGLDCDTNADCTGAGIICTDDAGPRLGTYPWVDVCLPSTCSDSVQNAGESGVDCGGTSDCGPCTNTFSSLGKEDFCNPSYPCGDKQGDCDADNECDSTLGAATCATDVGTAFGFAWWVDVCLLGTCVDGIQNGGETAIDCGGPRCKPCASPAPLGSSNYCSVTYRCAVREGDCDSDAECQAGLVCGSRNGKIAGLPAYVDVCVPACTNNHSPTQTASPTPVIGVYKQDITVDGGFITDADMQDMACNEQLRYLWFIRPSFGYPEWESTTAITTLPAYLISKIGLGTHTITVQVIDSFGNSASGPVQITQTNCGNALCEPSTGENVTTCAKDCKVCGDMICSSPYESKSNCFDCAVCGDNLCTTGETAENCSLDCGPPPPVCGNDVCETGETTESCPADCGPPPPACGNDVCETGETVENCGADCDVCGDTICGTSENLTTCGADCDVCGDDTCGTTENLETCGLDCDVCGDDTCGTTENLANCGADCDVCGDTICGTSETLGSCAVDCAVCGDDTCTAIAGEDPFTCLADCGFCGDKICDGEGGETTGNCSGDCGSGAVCPNGACELGESAETCPQDCQTGCADGVRDGFTNPQQYPNVASCAGGWSVAGLLAAVSCSRNSGDDGNNSSGTGCAAADLCATGWSICASGASARDVSGLNTCSNAYPPFSTGLFFASLQSSTGGAGCTATGTNDIWGCATSEVGTTPACATLNRKAANLCSNMPSSWACGSDNGAEQTNVTKDAGGGGVICCRDAIP